VRYVALIDVTCSDDADLDDRFLEGGVSVSQDMRGGRP
jgi:hypothetical protein